MSGHTDDVVLAAGAGVEDVEPEAGPEDERFDLAVLLPWLLASPSASPTAMTTIAATTRRRRRWMVSDDERANRVILSRDGKQTTVGTYTLPVALSTSSMHDRGACADTNSARKIPPAASSHDLTAGTAVAPITGLGAMRPCGYAASVPSAQVLVGLPERDVPRQGFL